MTSMQHLQTCSFADLNLFTSMILFTHNEMTQVTRDMISGACVAIPIWINLVGGSSHQCRRRRFILIGLIHPIPAAIDSMPHFAANLAGRTNRRVMTITNRTRGRTTSRTTMILTPTTLLLTTMIIIIGRRSRI